MTGIHDLFAEFSQPDEFHVQAQLELFAWRRKEAKREWAQFDYWRTKYSERRRASHRAASATYKKRNPEKQREWVRNAMARRYANDPAYRERVKEASRAYKAARKRAEQRAA
jgi:hypothetical protein